MVAERIIVEDNNPLGCSLAKISMVAEQSSRGMKRRPSCSLAKISMVAEPSTSNMHEKASCSLAKISMVAEPVKRASSI